jgi:hypothetical protein
MESTGRVIAVQKPPFVERFAKQDIDAHAVKVGFVRSAAARFPILG